MALRRTYRAGAIGDTGHIDAAGHYSAFRIGHDLHLPFQHIPGVEMVAVADPDPEGREQGRRDAGAGRAYADYREMLEKEKLDVVSVCSRQGIRHEAMILAAADAGCHIYVDKPFTTDLASADRIVAACDRAGVKLAVAHQSRYLEPFFTAKQMLERGAIGDLVSMQGRGKEDHRGGGEDLICCGVHVLDLMRFFAGDPRWVSGYVGIDGRAATRDDAYDPADRNGLVLGDALDGTFGFDHGVLGQMTTRRDQHMHGERWGLTLIGTEGVLSIRMFNDFTSPSKLRISRSASVPEEAGDFELLDVQMEPVVPGSEELNTGYPPTRGNRQAIYDLLKAAEEDRDPLSSGRSGRWTLEMALGIYAAHLSGARVALPLADRRHPLEALAALS